MNPNGFNVSSQRSLSKIQAFTSLRQVIRHQNQVGMTKLCNHHRPQTNPKLPEKKTQNTNTHMTTRTKLKENNQHSPPQLYACKAGNDTNCTSKKQVPNKIPLHTMEANETTTTETSDRNRQQLRHSQWGGGG